MTKRNIRKHRRNKWYPFWRGLKKGYDHFEATRQPAEVAVCEKRYMVNVKFVGNNYSVNPKGPCPAYENRPQKLWAGATGTMVSDNRYIKVVGPKRRLSHGQLVAYSKPGTTTGYGLFKIPTFSLKSTGSMSQARSTESMQKALGLGED